MDTFLNKFLSLFDYGHYDFSAVSRTDAAKQLANAVCPPVIESVFRDIAAAIGYEEE